MLVVDRELFLLLLLLLLLVVMMMMMVVVVVVVVFVVVCCWPVAISCSRSIAPAPASDDGGCCLRVLQSISG